MKVLCVLKNMPARHWWLTPTIPASQETEVGRLPSKADLGRPYLKNKLKQKELGAWLKR
jgi:hypothetical protein